MFLKQRYFFCMIFFLTMVFLHGCAAVNIPGNLMGISVPRINSSYPQATKQLNKSFKIIYNDVIDLFKDMKVSIYRKKKHVIAAYGFHNVSPYAIDTTQVAVYIKDIGNESTEVTIISPNKELTDMLSEKLFASEK